MRALPPAAGATSAELGADLDSGLRSALRKLGAAVSEPSGTAAATSVCVGRGEDRA